MNVLDEVRRKLASHPDIRFSDDGHCIRVLPVDTTGFEVGITAQASASTVFFEGWHEHFDSPDDALECFAFGLSTACRLVLVRRGDVAHNWTVQRCEQGQWVDVATVGLFFFPFWRKKHVEYLQNRIIVAEETVCP